MKYQTTEPLRQRAAIQQGPRKSIHSIIRLQEDAERKALIDGDEVEAKRAKDAQFNLGAAQERRRRKAYQPTEDELKATKAALGGRRDAICELLRDGHLTFWHMRPVHVLRSEVEHKGVSLATAWRTEFVDGGGAKGARILYRDKSGANAWNAAQNACKPRAWAGVYGLILGVCNMQQAVRLHKGKNEIVREIIKDELRKSLNAAGRSLGH